MKSTINLKEVAKFSQSAKNWWKANLNETKLLHKMNPFRLEYILNYAEIKGKKVLEIGSGGGILSMPLLRMGAELTAIEPSLELCKIATTKAKDEGLPDVFINTSLENLKEELFDVILIMDVIEHVEDVETFLQEAVKRLKKDGKIIISTINDTILSVIFVKFVAENILKLLPKNTHTAEKFISPDLILHYLPCLKKVALSGFLYNPITQNFKLTKNAEMNYFLVLSYK